MTHGYYMQFKFQCLSMKFYWNIVTVIHLYIVYGCVWATATELRNCDRDHLVHKFELFTIWTVTGNVGQPLT